MALPTGTVTFLFTDLEGSTRLWERHPDAMQPALARHDEILRSAVEDHDGVVVKTTGDGFHAAFVTAGDALGAALAAQAAIAAEPWGDTGPLPVRMGLHTGETQERDGDYYGTAVNRAARVMAVAHGGQILCSRATIEVAGDAFPTRSLGEHRLRDLGAPQELFQVGDGTFPPLRSLDAVPTNLPIVRTELIGRSDDVRGLAELARRERLVTLTGVGGVGKTRLALAVAAAAAAEFSDGCWLVELAPVAGGDEVVTTVAGAIRAPATTLDALAEYLADRSMVIVLDNCEHVLDAAADLVDAVLADAPDVHVIVTSREPLGLDGEQVRRVQSLGVPEAGAAPEAATSTAAVRLFAERAAAAADGFTINADNTTAVVEICRHLDGIPLAIELAAARVRGMAPSEIAARLDERFRLLAGGSRRTQERHRTLAATVAWSHDLLTDDEKVVFRRLAVFPASFDLSAAEAVAGDGTIDVVECVLRLVDRSLVVYEPQFERYRLLETLRQYGADRLADAGETDDVRRRHAEWFLGLAEQLGPQLEDARFAAARNRLLAELDNLRATADHCVETNRWASLAGFCLHLVRFVADDAPVDAAAWLRQVAEHGGDVDQQAIVDALGELAYVEAQVFGRYDDAAASAERSVALAEAAGLDSSAAAWNALATAAAYTGSFADGADAAARAFAVATARDQTQAVVIALGAQAAAVVVLGDEPRAVDLLDEALRVSERAGNPLAIRTAATARAGLVLWMRSEPDFAASFDFLRRRDGWPPVGDQSMMWSDFAWGTTLSMLGRPGGAEHLVRAVRAADRLDAPHVLDGALRTLAIAAAAAGFTGEAATLAAYADGTLGPHRIANPGQAWIDARLAEALGGLPDGPPASTIGRRDLLALVDDLEVALTRAESEPTAGA